MSRRRNPARALAAAVLLAVVTLPALLSPTPGHAQTVNTYVSNINQGGDNTYSHDKRRAQRFRTGPQFGGYTLTSVAIGSDDAEGDAFSAAIYSTNSGVPVSEVAALTPPSSFAAGTLTFTAPANTTLAASTTYTVVITVSSDSVTLDTTTLDGEDAGVAHGWSIGNGLRIQINSNQWSLHSTEAIRIAIKGSTTVNNPATGAPTITGTAEIGQTLTADTSGIADVDGLTTPGYTYQWVWVDGTDTDISGATSSAYTLVAADVGKTIKVRLSFTDDADFSETLTSAAASAPATGAPTITGTAEIGQTLTAHTSGIADANGLTTPDYTYQWVRVDGTDADISGATSTAYTLVAADLGKTIKVRVSFIDDAGNSETLTSAPTVVNTLYVSNINQGGDHYYNIHSQRRAAQSFRTGPQSGGYTVTHVDIGSDDADGDAFSAAINTTNSSGHPVSEVAALTPPSSFARGTLTFTVPANTTLAASTTYTVRIVQSSADDTVAVKLDTTTLAGEDAGVAQGWSIGNSFRTQSLNDPWTSQYAAIRIAIRGSTTVNYPATGTATITGTAEVGQTLTAHTSGIADANGLTTPDYTYQWVRVDGTDADISGATSTAYTLVAADLGKTIKVRVSFTDDAGNSETLTSAATAEVTALPGAPTGFTLITIGHLSMEVDWTAPIDDGGSAITEYRITGGNNVDLAVTSTSHIISVGSSGFVVGPYRLQVQAVNAVGRGPLSNSISVYLYPASVTIAAAEGVIEGTDAAFTLTTNQPVLTALRPLNVSVLVSESGNMVDSADKVAKTVSFDLGATAASLSVPTEDDDAVEFDSTVTATIVGDPDYILGSPSEAGVLVDDDEPHNFPYAVEDLAALPAGDGRVLLSWSAVTEQRGERISRFEYSQAENSVHPKSSFDSRIVATLPAGTYTIEATTVQDVPTTVNGIEPTGSFTLSVSADGGGGAPAPVATGCTPASLSLPVSGVEGAWANDCKSSVPGRGWARYYTFSLAASAEVTIGLQGSHDPHLYLREGSATSGTALHENNDIGSWLYIIPGSDDATTSHIVTGLNNGVPYAFRVRAVNAIGPADPSNSVNVTPSASVKPFEIQDLEGEAGDEQATLSWTVPYEGGSPITMFQYRQKKGGGSYDNWKNIPNSGPTTDSFTVPDRRVGDHYTFQVRAVNSHGEADASNEASVTVLTGVLLTNLSQTGGGVSNNNNNNFNDTSQPFTTGSGPNIGSYTLQSINIVGAAALATLPTLTVTLEADSSGNPSGTPLCTFTNPSSWKSGPNNEFTPATLCRLDPSVKYHIAMDAGGAPFEYFLSSNSSLVNRSIQEQGDPS